MRRGRGWAAVTVATMLALAGCTGESEAPPTTPDATSPVASPSATSTSTPAPDAATPPERPDMSAVDAATAEAVARYFLELYPYVYATGDLTEWQALSHPECIFCASVITNVEEMVAAGNTASGGEIDADIAAAEITGGTFAVTGLATQGPGFEYDSSGATSDESAGGTYEVALNVVGDSGGWLIRAVEFREPSP